LNLANVLSRNLRKLKGRKAIFAVWAT